MDFAELLINLNTIIGLCYFLLSVLIMLAPLSIKSLRVLGLWGAVMALHAIIFLSGCGLHHLDLESHIFAQELIFDWHGLHILMTSLMQIYGALGVAAVGIFKGSKMMDRLRTELVRARRKKDV
jgi:hypothetical protein